MSASSDSPASESTGFADLGLPAPLLRALADVGYESPSPIQLETIPALLAGRDLVGQAQTGTGKTAAFALPILARLDLTRAVPQALVLAPTRELAIQVAEAFQTYAGHMRGFHVLPIYGGQGYGPQLAGLRRGAHVIVGTPGRVIDHLQRGTLDLRALTTLVLDEGDEMLRMGFIDDVESVLSMSPPGRQVALFSATMPAQVRRIAQTHLREPVEITIRSKTTTAANTRQRYLAVSGVHKLDALTRILEVESFDAMIVFTRTKVATEELAHRLEARGFAAAPLNGDIPQAQRERTVARLKSGELDILVATDVAARGLDVDRISHVLNFDIPIDIESYVHRIGRTGRAGRSGEAILFVTHREQHLLRAIERATRQRIEPMAAPTLSDVNEQRIVRFKQRIDEALTAADLDTFRRVVEQFAEERDVPVVEIAAALARMAQGKTPLLEAAPVPAAIQGGERETRPPRPSEPQHRAAHSTAPERRPRSVQRPDRDERTPDVESVRYRIAVGNDHGVKASNIVGAIANEAGLDSRFIGRIDIHEDFSFVELPSGMPREMLRHLRKVWVAGQQLQMTLADDGDGDEGMPQQEPRRPFRPGPGAPPRSPRPSGPRAAGPRPSYDDGPPRHDKPKFARSKAGGKAPAGKSGFAKPGFAKPKSAKPKPGKPKRDA
jgi:ATP-dependent RNA helicase DeaD